MKITSLLVFIWLCHGLNFAQDTLFLPVRHEGKWHFIDTTGTLQMQKPAFDRLEIHNFNYQDYYAIEINGKYGLLSAFLQPVLAAEFDTIISNGYVLLAKKDKQWTSFLFTYDPESLKYESINKANFEADSIFLQNSFIYTYQNNKCGLIYNSKLIAKPEFERIAPISAGIYSNLYFLTYENKLFGLIDDTGQELLAPKYEEIQNFDHNCFRIKQGNWKYFNKNLNLIIDPKGHEIVFYSPESWKIYDAPDGSCAFFTNGKRFDAGFDDYFPQTSSTKEIKEIAVRKNGKIGLIDKKGNILIEAKFDQIEWIKDDFFRYFIGDLCGLISREGKIKTEAVYHNIIFQSFTASKRFIVIKDNKTGVIDEDGKEIIPLQYDFVVDHLNYFQLQKNGKFGAANAHGKILAPVEYDEINFSYSQNSDMSLRSPTLVICRKNNDYSVYNKHGLLSRGSSNHYQSANNTIKLYGAGFIDVHALADDGTEESYQRYESTPSIVIEQNWTKFDDYTSKHPYSTVIENQLAGKSGLRHFAKAGYPVAPEFYRIRKDKYNSLNLAEIPVPKSSIYPLDSIGLSTTFANNIVSLSSGTRERDFIINSELLTSRFRGSSSDEEMKWDLNGQMSWISRNSGFSLEQQEKISYIDDAGAYYRRILFGAESKICDIGEADMSLLEYWKYLNKHDYLWFEGQKSALDFMNPRLGVKFEGGYWLAFRDNSPLEHDKQAVQYDIKTVFDEFVQAEPQNSHLFFIKEKNRYFGRLEDFKNDTTKIEGISNFLSSKNVAPVGGQGFLYYEKNDPQGAIIDALQPGIFFQTNSSDLRFSDGKILFKEQGFYGVKNIRGEILVPAQFDQIDFLGAERLAIKTKAGWGLCYMDGKFISDRTYDSILPFSNGFSRCKKEHNVTCIINTSGDEIRTIEPNASELLKGSVFLEFVNGKSCFLDAKGKTLDSLGAKEVLVYEQWISGINKRGKGYARAIGSENLFWKGGKAPKKWGGLLLMQEGKQLQFLDSNGTHSPLLKGDKIRFYGEKYITVATGKKISIYNRSGKMIHEASEKKEIVLYDDLLFIQWADTGYFTNQEGEILRLNEKLQPAYQLPEKLEAEAYDEVKRANDYFLVRKSGKWGIANSKGDVLVNCIYPFISHESGSYFRVPNQRQIYVTDLYLKPVFDSPFEEISTLNQEVLRLKSGNAYGYTTLKGRWIWKMQ